MSEKVKSFGQFLNESSRMDLPTPGYVQSLPEYKEIQKIFPNVRVYGGGSQPLEFGGTQTNYYIKYSRTGSIYYGGYSVGTFRQVDDESLKFIKDYLVSKAVDISVTSLDSIIEGRTPISNKILKKEWERYYSNKFEIFKKGVLDRVKDFSNTIKYYQNHPLDKSYELMPGLKKIVQEGFEKSPAKEIKEGDLTLEQKNYLKNKITRQTDPKYQGYNPDLKGKPMFKLNKETGLVDVYGNFTHGYYSPAVEGNKNFMGIKFGKAYGSFKTNSEKSLPEKNLSGFPIEVDKDFELTDDGRIKSLEGFPDLKGQKISIKGTAVSDFSPLNEVLSGIIEIENMDLSENTELKSLTQIKFPEKVKRLNISNLPIKSLEGCPNEIGELNCVNVDIENLKGAPKMAETIMVDSPKLKDIKEILEIKGLKTFSFRTEPDFSYLYIRFPFKGTKEEVEKIINEIKSDRYSDRDKGLFLSVIGDSYYDYFGQNPLELYLLNDFPDIKKDIMQKKDIPDLGRLGSTLNKGFL